MVAGWRIFRARWMPAWLLPAAWDMVKFSVAFFLLPRAGLFLARWDFTLGVDIAGTEGGLRLRYTLPPTMPTVEQMGIGIATPVPVEASSTAVLLMLLFLALDCTLRGGYINLVHAALHNVGPSLGGFWRGALRFAPRFFFLTLLWMGWSALGGWLADSGTLPHSSLPAINLVFLLVLALAEFVTVTDDVLPPVAALGAPLLFLTHLGPLVGVVVVTGLLSIGLVGLVSLAVGPYQAWLLAPAWSLLGTWMTASALSALETDISTRRETRGSLSWPCPSCRVNNHPLASVCVACGRPEKEPLSPSAAALPLLGTETASTD
jgi:hypothetical protein